MNGGGTRQLPSWMLRPCAIEQASASDVKQANKENDLGEVDTKACQPKKKGPRKKLDSGVPMVENKSHLLKKREPRTRDGKPSQQEDNQHENRPGLLKQCRTSKHKQLQKRDENHVYDLPKSNLEKKDGSMRKRSRGNSSGKKKKVKKKLMEDSLEDTVASQDELTVEDLVSIAEEYVNADMKKELQNSENLQFNSRTKFASSSILQTGSQKDPAARKEDRKSLTHKLLPSESISSSPVSVEKSITCPISTGDPVQDMLNLLLGPTLKKSEEVEWKNDAITKIIIRDHERDKRSKNDTLTEVIPEMKKKASLKDKVAMLLH